MPMIDMVQAHLCTHLTLPSTFSISNHCLDMKSGNLSFVREGIKSFLTSTEEQFTLIPSQC